PRRRFRADRRVTHARLAPKGPDDHSAYQPRVLRRVRRQDMTAEPINPIPKVADNRETPEAVTTMVRHVRETWQEVEPYTPEVAQFFYGMLFTLAPEARDFFPIHMDVRSGKLVRAIVNILQ